MVPENCQISPKVEIEKVEQRHNIHCNSVILYWMLAISLALLLLLFSIFHRIHCRGKGVKSVYEQQALFMFLSVFSFYLNFYILALSDSFCSFILNAKDLIHGHLHGNHIYILQLS